MRQENLQNIEKALIGGLYVTANVYFDHHRELHPGLFNNDKTKKLFVEIIALRESGKKPEIHSLSDKLSIPTGIISDCIQQWRSKAREYIDILQADFLKRQLSEVHSNAVMDIESGADPVETHQAATNLANEVIGTNSSEETGIKAACIEAMNQIEEAKNKKGAGISTGSYDIDDMTGGFSAGDQFVLAARPGTGKTTLAAGWLIEVVKQGIPVMFYSLEMTKARFMSILAAIISGVSTKKMRNGTMTTAEENKISEALDWLYEKPIYISTGSRTINQIIGSARYHARKFGVRVFFYDYVQIIRGGQMRWNATYRIGDYSQRLKEFANDYKVTNVVLCQVNRDSEKANREPLLSDIKDSGSIEQDASAVIMMYKPDPNKNLIRLFLRKNRFGDLAHFDRLWVKRKFINTGGEPYATVEN